MPAEQPNFGQLTGWIPEDDPLLQGFIEGLDQHLNLSNNWFHELLAEPLPGVAPETSIEDHPAPEAVKDIQEFPGSFKDNSLDAISNATQDSPSAGPDAVSNSNSGFDYFVIPCGDDRPRDRYVVEPAHDERYVQDSTSFMPDQAWLSEDNLPPALGMLEPIYKKDVPRTERLDRTSATGYIVDSRFNHILPPIISWKVEPWRVLYWKSIEPSLQNDHIIDRMPWKTFTDVETPGCPYSHRVIIRHTMVERERKWRLKAGGLSRVNSNKERVSKDEIQIMERLIENCDLSDPNSVFKACQRNVVWEIDWDDMTMRQPMPKLSKGKACNYLGHKFPLPPPMVVVSERVIKTFNQIACLAKEHPNLKASDALQLVDHCDRNHEKRRAAIEAKQETGRTHRPPPERKIKKLKAKKTQKASNAPSAGSLLAQQFDQKLQAPKDNFSTPLQNNASIAPSRDNAFLLQADLKNPRKRKMDDDHEMSEVHVLQEQKRLRLSQSTAITDSLRRSSI